MTKAEIQREVLELPEHDRLELAKVIWASLSDPEMLPMLQERQAERERLRLEVLEQARAAIRKRAPEFPAIRAVYLFGSVCEPGWFHAGSDVNVAVDCDDLEVETPFCRALERELKRDVYAFPRQGQIAREIEIRGEYAYERRSSAPRC